jgi:hypothetical protein
MKNEFTAPNFAFEMDEEELVAEGLARGFIKVVDEDLYRYAVELAEQVS